MTQIPRHLIISPDLRTWKLEQPVLFLGKWCLREQDRQIWDKMDSIIAKPIGEGPNERYLLHLEARRIESKLFPKLVDVLNKQHGIERSQRYWKIVLGHWLREVVQLLLNRVTTIEKCLSQHKIGSITLYECRKSNLAANEYGDIWKQSMDNCWNAEVYEKILAHFQVRHIAIERIRCSPNENHEDSMPIVAIENIIPTKERFYKKTRRIVDIVARELANKIGRETDAFIVNSYLPPEKELLLNVALGQFPQRRTTPPFKARGKVDSELRNELSHNMKVSNVSKEEEIIASLLFELIPTNYLEDYESLVRTSDSLGWPKEPKFIFTSNNFVADEVFKIWTAEKTIKGTQYIVGQHGNRYGTHKINELTIEEVTSDRFLTWGWKRGLPQHTPAFIFKNANRSKKRNFQSTGLLLVEENPVARFEVWEQAHQFEEYMKEQFKFVSGLAEQVRDNLVVRLHAAYQIMQGEGDLRWRNFDKEIKLDLGEIPIRELWLTNRIIVHSYDSTGILETLEANRPTLAFWQNGLSHLVDEAIPFYELLIGAGIVHLSPESAAAKINEVWVDLDSWWQSSEVQNARKIFCHEYARTSQKPIRDLKKILLKGI